MNVAWLHDFKPCLILKQWRDHVCKVWLEQAAVTYKDLPQTVDFCLAVWCVFVLKIRQFESYIPLSSQTDLTSQAGLHKYSYNLNEVFSVWIHPQVQNKDTLTL